MADRRDGENLTHSQINSCDEFFDLCCTPCSKKKRNRSALKYCVNCKEYFCVTCVENHDSFQAMSGHLLVDPRTSISSPSKTGGRKFHAIPTELCQHHPMEVVNMYCGEEDIVGCSVCFTINHKSCDDIHYIPEYVQSNFPPDQVNRINNDLTEAIKAMKKLKTQHDRLDDNLEKSKDNCKQEIQKYREDINQIIDKIEATTLEELDARHKDRKKNTEDTTRQDVHDKMIRFKSELESDQNNEAQKFVIAKLSQCTIKQGQELQSKISNDQTTELTFTRNTDIMIFLLSIVTLGMLSLPVKHDSSLPTVRTSSKQLQSTQSKTRPSASTDNKTRVFPKQYTSGVVSKKTLQSTQSKTSSSASTDNKTRVFPIQDTSGVVSKKTLNRGLYKVLDKSEYNIKQLNDKSVCDIMSSCLLDNGNILLADFGTKKLKLVESRTFTVRTSLALDDQPWSVSRVSSTEAAVSLSNDTIQFVSTSGDKLVLGSISINCYGKCIAVVRDKMYTGYGRSVSIYTLNGELVQTINIDKVINIWDITVSDDEKMIHVAALNLGVITLNTDGHVVWRYSGTGLRDAWGVCTDGNGNVIVCGRGSNNVIQLGSDGHYMGQIASGSEGVLSPQAMCYDRNTHKLIVGRKDNNITVFTVQ